MTRQQGFTRLELAVLATVVAGTFGLMMLLSCGPSERETRLQSARNKAECMNNLRQIGGLLVTLQSSGRRITNHSGAPFLLQVAGKVKDTDLEVFLCPGEVPPAGRPEPGSEEFVALYRENTDLRNLTEETLAKMCSYAGPNWRDHPYEPASSETRIWACDACRGGELHHYGIVVLWESNKVNFIDIEELEGQEEDRIVVGPGSGDPRLATMTFHPRQ